MSAAAPTATVVAVARDSGHHFSKPLRDEITLVENHGVEGDAHAGATVRHLHDVRKDATRPNLRQVHLMHAELFDEVAADGFAVDPGTLGENVTTRGVDLLGLPEGTRIRLGSDAVVELTGLRTPCNQINGVQQGLMKRLVEVDDDGTVRRLSGVMGVVAAGGVVRAGDAIEIELPDAPHRALGPV
ncbi:MOSC domain-containing protein [Agromyces mangrovi Wang et al. 2018]|uniref:MOSC domain-containing protein n=1 Tax=Agromyces mangrovi TaxID=1858653 RepID=UPI0025742227|nr:MOSC domain-containing protein [Agromyces mangrovi]BDZ65153.1 MOSC domain-containing protein [Agromyces mangrovi]